VIDSFSGRRNRNKRTILVWNTPLRYLHGAPPANIGHRQMVLFTVLRRVGFRLARKCAPTRLLCTAYCTSLPLYVQGPGGWPSLAPEIASPRHRFQQKTHCPSSSSRPCCHRTQESHCCPPSSWRGRYTNDSRRALHSPSDLLMNLADLSYPDVVGAFATSHSARPVEPGRLICVQTVMTLRRP